MLSEEIFSLSERFAACKGVLTAIGDETRLHILLEMMKMGDCDGVRVGEITRKTNLSRPAVSHHLRILREAGVLRVRREGTKNFYYFDRRLEAFDRLSAVLRDAAELARRLPEGESTEADSF